MDHPLILNASKQSNKVSNLQVSFGTDDNPGLRIVKVGLVFTSCFACLHAIGLLDIVLLLRKNIGGFLLGPSK
jgi:hypothetical protein